MTPIETDVHSYLEWLELHNHATITVDWHRQERQLPPAAPLDGHLDAGRRRRHPLRSRDARSRAVGDHPALLEGQHRSAASCPCGYSSGCWTRRGDGNGALRRAASERRPGCGEAICHELIPSRAAWCSGVSMDEEFGECCQHVATGYWLVSCSSVGRGGQRTQELTREAAINCYTTIW